MSHFLPTTRKIVQFSDHKSPKVIKTIQNLRVLILLQATDKIVYIDGGFDLFHIKYNIMYEFFLFL